MLVPLGASSLAEADRIRYSATVSGQKACEELGFVPRFGSGEVAARFGDLTPAQLNWKPSADAWSVGQCFDHLITTHGLYLPLFYKLASGATSPSLWQRVSPFSGYFGRFLIRTVDPDNPRKVKTTSRAQPSAASDIDARIIERFGEHQKALIDHLERLPDGIDRSMVITSPLLGLITYSLDDCLTILVFHGRRHIDQARRLTGIEGFPPSEAV